MKPLRRLGIAVLVAAPIMVGLIVLVYLPLVGGDRGVVSGSGSVVTVGPIELSYGSGPSPSGQAVTDFEIWVDLDSYEEPVVDTPLQFAVITVRNRSDVPVHVQSQDTFAPGYVGLLSSNVSGVRELALRAGETCFAQLGVVFGREEWTALEEGDYPFEVTIVAQQMNEARVPLDGDETVTLMPCSPAG